VPAARADRAEDGEEKAGVEWEEVQRTGMGFLEAFCRVGLGQDIQTFYAFVNKCGFFENASFIFKKE